MGYIWMKDFMREKEKEMEMEMEKLDDPTIRNHWVIYQFPFPFLFPHQILDPKTALRNCHQASQDI